MKMNEKEVMEIREKILSLSQEEMHILEEGLSIFNRLSDAVDINPENPHGFFRSIMSDVDSETATEYINILIKVGILSKEEVEEKLDLYSYYNETEIETILAENIKEAKRDVERLENLEENDDLY